MNNEVVISCPDVLYFTIVTIPNWAERYDTVEEYVVIKSF
jgi:hypothetical protein